MTFLDKGLSFVAVALFATSAIAEDAKPKAAPPANAPAAAAPVAGAAPQAPAAKAPATTAATPGATAVPQDDGWSTEKDPGGITLDASQTDIVKLVSGYFSNLKGMKGAFLQTTSDKKRMKGKFFVKRPGRFRFDYALPSKQVIVSDGNDLAIQDLDLNTEDRLELKQTPFRLLLRKDVDLVRDAKITEVQQADDLIVLALQDKSPDTPGRIRLFMSTKPSLELKEWVTTDAQGLDTRIEVSELVNTDDLDEKIFKIQQVTSTMSRPQ